MRKRKINRVNNPYSVILALFLGVAVAVGGSVWATTIGTNVSVSGTLTSTGNATMSADLTVNSGMRVGTGSTGGHITALADDSLFVEGESEFDGIAWFDDSLRASSTAQFTGAITTYGNQTLGDASSDTLTVNATSTFAAGVTINAGGLSVTAGGFTVANNSTLSGTLNVNGNVTLGDASGDTLTVTGNSITYSNAGTTTIPSANANAWGYATSSANIPLLKLDTSNTRVGISTTTPGAALAVGGTGNAVFGGTGTTSISIQPTGASRGGCIELMNTSGTQVMSIMATSTTEGHIVTWHVGGCN